MSTVMSWCRFCNLPRHVEPGDQTDMCGHCAEIFEAGHFAAIRAEVEYELKRPYYGLLASVRFLREAVAAGRRNVETASDEYRRRASQEQLDNNVAELGRRERDVADVTRWLEATQ